MLPLCPPPTQKARVKEARVKQSALEQVDARGSDAMWGDDDEAFELELTNFGVDTAELREEVTRRLFHVWVEDWELELLKKKCPVAEAMLLEKYKGELSFVNILCVYYEKYKIDTLLFIFVITRSCVL